MVSPNSSSLLQALKKRIIITDSPFPLFVAKKCDNNKEQGSDSQRGQQFKDQPINCKGRVGICKSCRQ